MGVLKRTVEVEKVSRRHHGKLPKRYIWTNVKIGHTTQLHMHVYLLHSKLEYCWHCHPTTQPFTTPKSILPLKRYFNVLSISIKLQHFPESGILLRMYPKFFLELITTQLRFYMVSPQLSLLISIKCLESVRCFGYMIVTEKKGGREVTVFFRVGPTQQCTLLI